MKLEFSPFSSKTKLISMHRKDEPGLMYNLLKPLARVSRTYK